MGARGRSTRPGCTGGYARAFRYRRVLGQLRLTAAPLDRTAGAAHLRTSIALAAILWDQAVVPLGLGTWEQHQRRNPFAALPGLGRFEVRALRSGLERYLSRFSRSVVFVDTPTPLGWMIFMERLDASDDCSEGPTPFR